ncbi:aromatic/alkene monooxygenase hydroxylase subunit beta [Thiosocius teredinicola]|uniref:aromatic/alkene monooxygenase hydroxylase subunit beta n=1 Tax=Thiosocius teredinicola TaxID=1973002 RepID=UPI000990A328
MQIDIKTDSVEPIRQTFAHVARRLGVDKPASRYQEATLDVQSEINFHYRPLWDPDREIFDRNRTAVKMDDWYAFRDPRQYYYGAWTITRSRQQDSMERNFAFVEKRQLFDTLEPAWRQRVADVLLPLRHLEYGANLNNTYITAYGWGTAITQATSFAAMDRLGIAQYLSRIGLIMDGNTGESLDTAKQAWMQAEQWQPLRRLVEDLLVVDDWFELYVAQNFALDGLLFPLVYERFDAELAQHGGSAMAMLTEFMVDWSAEHTRCVDAFLKTAAEESPQNKALLSSWTHKWSARCADALLPLAKVAVGDTAVTVIAELQDALQKRGQKKAGLDI